MYLILAIVIHFSFAELPIDSEKCESKSEVTMAFNIFSVSETKIDRRGCCSHHGGVCGCSSGRAVCCDGSLSPSCGCN